MKQLLFVLILSLFADAKMLPSTPFNEIQKAIASGKRVLVEVGSDHCLSCQKMGKLLYTIKQEHPNFQIFFLNIEQNRDAAKKLQIMLIPTQILYEKKKEVYRHIGVLSKKEVIELLK
ncbi:MULTISPECIES: thioredoxin family protein [unclassified Nitratiruptor]|uniref:thioredoxin family protein n=1 Tax=unclassified Nitratiruptor TaxID=2624044 RepID=UPI00191684C0|nr:MULTISPECIES: thioredoxin family protein [unclassified Nitratiruptor]BCD59350.1 thioredoxin 1 [Nitratiruptor sp. YY08-10]BCD63274.1 thioredoxin 1 [Nitratiruptor sp. YY08-14]